MKPNKKRILLVSLTIIWCLPPLLWGTAAFRGSCELESAIRHARAAGLPTTFKELGRKVPPEDNAGPLYQRALSFRRQHVADDFKHKLQLAELYRRGTLNYRLLSDYVVRDEALFPLIEQASRKRDCDFGPPDLGEGWPAYPGLDLLTDFAADARLHARSASHQGDWRRSLYNLQIGMGIARHLNTPDIMGLLKRVGI